MCSLLLPAGINRPLGLAVCLDFSADTYQIVTTGHFFSQHQMRLNYPSETTAFLCIILNRVTQFTLKSESNTRTRGDSENVKQVKGGDGPCGLVALCLESSCHICLWLCDLLWFCKWLVVQTFTNEAPSLLISCGVTLTITNKKMVHRFHMPPAGASLHITTYQSLHDVSVCKSLK